MMPVSLRLAIRQWLARPVRPILCSLAIAAAVTLVLSVAAGFDSAKESLRIGIGQILGSADIHVRPAGKNYQMYLTDDVLDQVRRQPEVELASGRLDDIQVSLTHGPEHRWFHSVAIQPNLDDKLRPMRFAAGKTLSGKTDEIMIDTTVARLMGLNTGDTATLNGDWDKPRVVRIVGIVEKPQIELIAKPTVYVPMESVTALLNLPPRYRVLDVKLKSGVNAAAYENKLSKMLNPAGKKQTIQVTSEEARQSKLEKSFSAFNAGLAAISTVAVLCAALIIGTTLSVGIQERIRQFGRLRCIGASRIQLIIILLSDAFLLMIMGTAAGIAAGWLLSSQLVKLAPDIFLTFTVERQSLVIAAGVGLLATLLGSLIPAWQMARISPMQAVQNTANQSGRKLIWISAALGIAAIGVQIALWQIPSRDWRIWSYMGIGVPFIFLGYCLIGPMALTIFEKIFAPMLARLFGLRQELLREAWSRTPWRAGAMVAALMIGVTLFTAVHQRSNALTKTLSFPAKFPDLFLYSFGYFPQERVDRMRQQIPEITESTTLSLIQTRTAQKYTPIAGVVDNTQTNFVSIDPASFEHVIDVKFVQGDAQTAWKKLAEGNHILVSREFQTLYGKGVGDTIALRDANGSSVTFTIAGVISSTGMDMARAYFDVGSAVVEASVTSVMGSQADAQKYFNLKGNKIVLVNLNKNIDADTVEKIIRPKLVAMGFESISSVMMKQSISQVIGRVVGALSLIALATLIIASLGVANMVIASTHARRFEFGVLRAIGAGRSQLVRIVLAEITIVALTAGILGSCAGIHYVFMATRIDRTMIGMTTPFAIVFGPLAIGIGITLLLGWMAAIVPAVRAAFSAQRTLLAGGRD